MAVFRVPKIENFTMMSNHHLRNKKLSLKAVGLMSKILSLPDEWDYSLKGLAKLNADGIDGVRSAVQELEDAGYIIRRQRRDKNGRMAKTGVGFTVIGKADTGKTGNGCPDIGKPNANKYEPSNYTPRKYSLEQYSIYQSLRHRTQK